MTNEEVNFMKSTVMSVFRNRSNPTWIKAFEEYNLENYKKLGMGCAPCYGKVLRFHIFKNSDAHKLTEK